MDSHHQQQEKVSLHHEHNKTEDTDLNWGEIKMDEKDKKIIQLTMDLERSVAQNKTLQNDLDSSIKQIKEYRERLKQKSNLELNIIKFVGGAMCATTNRELETVEECEWYRKKLNEVYESKKKKVNKTYERRNN